MTRSQLSAGSRTAVLPIALLVVLVSFAANSLILRFVVQHHLLEAALLSEVRFLAGAVMLIVIAFVRGAPRDVVPRRRHIWPAFWLGVYALPSAYGYQHIGAAPGTFVFYAAVFVALVAFDAARGQRPSTRRIVCALIALSGLGVLATAQLGTVTTLGVVMLAGTGAAWGLYTAVGRGTTDPLAMTTGNFVLLGCVLLVPTLLGFAHVLGAPTITLAGVVWGVVMGAGTTACAYALWYWCLRLVKGTQAGLIQLAIPILTGLGAVGLLGEPFSLRLGVAAGLVVLGLSLGVT